MWAVPAALLEGMGEYHDIWSQRSHDSHYMPAVGPIVPLAVLGTSPSAWCSSKNSETVRHDGKAHPRHPFAHVLVCFDQAICDVWTHDWRATPSAVVIRLMSKPEGAYSETNCLLFCWREEITKINQSSFLSVCGMTHYLGSSALQPLIKRSCSAWVTPVILDV